MAKVVELWFGRDTYGNHGEVAKRADGQYFARNTEFNGFGQGWTKWREFTPSFHTHGTNAYSGEAFEYDEPQVFWGFHKMDKCSDVSDVRYRLPNPQ